MTSKSTCAVLQFFGIFAQILVITIAVPSVSAASDTNYVGSEVCASCHQTQFDAWRGSHHDLAMQPANVDTVLGDFSGSSFSHNGVTSQFFKKDGRYYVNTEGASGELKDFEIKYTFGAEPLQQYLVPFDNGGMQVLGAAWDTRPAKYGGQRWFHVYGDENIPHTDELHWTARAQTWNYQCADCHSLNVRKNYDPKTDSYATAWDVIDVGCEGCHGPGSEHVRLAPRFDDGHKKNKGLTHLLSDSSGGQWLRSEKDPVAHRTAPLESNNEVNACARCHSRRAQLRERPFSGQALLDDYRPALITPPLYHLDGQINDEVYVYGSFLQSRMHGAGVVCSDCHDPHSGRTHAEGNALCATCHASDVYNVAAHHHHADDSPGAQCVECHMPSKNYMVIDTRHDHSMRVPRPDLSIALGTPNACNQCHDEKTTQWASNHVAQWKGGNAPSISNYADLLAAAQIDGPDGLAAANALVGDDNAPSIIRATAAQALGRYPARATLPSLMAAASAEDDELLRLGAIGAVASSVTPMKLQIGLPNAYDDLLSIRVAAARILAAIPTNEIPEKTRTTVNSAMAEYIATQELQADHPGALANLGAFFADRQDLDLSEQAYKRALRLLPDHVGATIGLADLYRIRKQDEEAIVVLRRALERTFDSPDLHHALGLALVRQKYEDEALEHLGRAANLAPNNRRYQYVVAIARRSYGKLEEALAGLEPAFDRYSSDVQIILLLAELHFENNNHEKAIEYAERLVDLVPDDPRALEFLQGLVNSGQ